MKKTLTPLASIKATINEIRVMTNHGYKAVSAIRNQVRSVFWVQDPVAGLDLVEAATPVIFSFVEISMVTKDKLKLNIYSSDLSLELINLGEEKFLIEYVAQQLAEILIDYSPLRVLFLSNTPRSIASFEFNCYQAGIWTPNIFGRADFSSVYTPAPITQVMENIITFMGTVNTVLLMVKSIDTQQKIKEHIANIMTCKLSTMEMPQGFTNPTMHEVMPINQNLPPINMVNRTYDRKQNAINDQRLSGPSSYHVPPSYGYTNSYVQPLSLKPFVIDDVVQAVPYTHIAFIESLTGDVHRWIRVYCPENKHEVANNFSIRWNKELTEFYISIDDVNVITLYPAKTPIRQVWFDLDNSLFNISAMFKAYYGEIAYLKLLKSPIDQTILADFKFQLDTGNINLTKTLPIITLMCEAYKLSYNVSVITRPKDAKDRYQTLMQNKESLRHQLYKTSDPVDVELLCSRYMTVLYEEDKGELSADEQILIGASKKVNDVWNKAHKATETDYNDPIACLLQTIKLKYAYNPAKLQVLNPYNL